MYIINFFSGIQSHFHSPFVQLNNGFRSEFLFSPHSYFCLEPKWRHSVIVVTRQISNSRVFSCLIRAIWVLKCYKWPEINHINFFGFGQIAIFTKFSMKNEGLVDFFGAYVVSCQIEMLYDHKFWFMPVTDCATVVLKPNKSQDKS